MKKIYFLLFFVSIIAANTNAQVAIGTKAAPERGAILELKSDSLGLLLPRVQLQGITSPDPIPVHQKGLVVFNETISPADNLYEGLYCNTGTKWIRLETANFFNEVWFYMPSILFDTKAPDGETYPLSRSVNLYDEFYKQSGDNSNTKAVSSSLTRKMAFNTVLAPENYDYFVTDFDEAVFSEIEITPQGLMTYKIKELASEKTFINIVFVEK